MSYLISFNSYHCFAIAKKKKFKMASKLITQRIFSVIQSNPRIISATFSSSVNPCNSFKVQDTRDFDERVKNSKVPVIVDFFATWCNPCKMLAPRIESVIEEKKGKILLAKVDIDENNELALNYDVAAVPVLLAIKDGKVEDRLVGLQDTDKIRQFVDKYVK